MAGRMCVGEGVWRVVNSVTMYVQRWRAVLRCAGVADVLVLARAWELTFTPLAGPNASHTTRAKSCLILSVHRASNAASDIRPHSQVQDSRHSRIISSAVKCKTRGERRRCVYAHASFDNGVSTFARSDILPNGSSQSFICEASSNGALNV